MRRNLPFWILMYLSAITLLGIFMHSPKKDKTISNGDDVDSFDERGIAFSGVNYRHHRECAPLHFSTVPLKRTALASFPGSGNTWHRHLIQQLTGILTGDIYNLLQLVPSPHKQNATRKYLALRHLNWNGSVVAIKTHEGAILSSKFEPSKYDQAVVIVRNPYHALVAEFNRQNPDKEEENLGHGKIAKVGLFYTKKFSTFVSFHAPRWYNFHLRWLTLDMKIHLLQYEKTLTDMETQLIDLGRFLGVNETTLQNKTHMNCVIENSGRGLKRQSRILSPSPFTQEMNKTIDHYRENIRRIASKRFATVLTF